MNTHVTQSEDPVSTLESHVLINLKTTLVALSRSNLGHQVPRNLASDVSLSSPSKSLSEYSIPYADEETVKTHSSPDQDTERNLNKLFLLVLNDDGLLLDLLDHGTGEDIDVVLLEGRLGVLNQLLQV